MYIIVEITAAKCAVNDPKCVSLKSMLRSQRFAVWVLFLNPHWSIIFPGC